MREIADSPYGEISQDRYGSGGFLQQFEAEIASLLGKEAAVFMPSGTMAQQIALRIWADRIGNKRSAFHPTCHLEIHEHKAYRELHHLEAVLVGSPERPITVADLEAIEEPVSSLLLELPQREIGGQLPSWDELLAQADWARARSARLHMDGARLWECAPFYGRPYAEIAAPFDTVYVSFYKILQGLPGAALAGPADVIKEARIWQRRHGGNLQQQSPAAVSAKLGLDRHLPRMAEYCAKAIELCAAFRDIEGVTVVPDPPHTNMMHIHLRGDADELRTRSLEVADETNTLVVDHVAPSGREGVQKWELTVGTAGLDIPTEEAVRLLRRIVGAD
jgi:threonine aldolase